MTGLADAVERVAAGQPDAFAEIVAATEQRLFRLAARLLADASEAEDVLQEAYVRAYDSILAGTFDRRASVETWLYRIVVNSARDALRSRSRARARARAAAELDPRATTTDGHIEARDALRQLATLLDSLPADQRTAFVLKELEGLPTREIAALERCSEGAVEQRLVRARTTLRTIHD